MVKTDRTVRIINSRSDDKVSFLTVGNDAVKIRVGDSEEIVTREELREAVEEILSVKGTRA